MHTSLFHLSGSGMPHRCCDDRRTARAGLESALHGLLLIINGATGVCITVDMTSKTWHDSNVDQRRSNGARGEGIREGTNLEGS